MKEQSSVQSIARAFAIIELLCTHGSLGITQLSQSSGLHKATVYRIISTLSDLGYVSQNKTTEKYKLTIKFLKISSLMLAKNDTRKNARSILENLPKMLGETVHLVERSNNDIVYIDKFESLQNSVRMVSRIGLSLPMIYTAVGKSILAQCTDAEIKKVWESTDKVQKTANTILDFNDFMSEIEKVRVQGFAVDDEENEIGVRCIAAAIPDIYGSYSYAFSVSAPVSRMDNKKMQDVANHVLIAKEQLIEKFL